MSERKRNGMAGDRTQQTYEQDRDRIDVSEPHECSYWTEKLGVSYETLKHAVAQVGPLAKDVRRHLGR